MSGSIKNIVSSTEHVDFYKYILCRLVSIEYVRNWYINLYSWHMQ